MKRRHAFIIWLVGFSAKRQQRVDRLDVILLACNVERRPADIRSILTGWSSIETSTIVGVYATWAEVISKAKEILEKGNGYGENFWCTEENGGYREVYSDEEYEGEGFEDKTDTAKEPTGERYDVTCELATAQHCEGAKGNMILVAQRLTGVALA